jgi:cytochrome bd ubiquinol oxidase subunit I
LGISAYHLVRKQNVTAFQYSFRLAAIIGLIATVSVAFSGDEQGRYLREVQPMAAAASEALWETADPAPFTVIAIFDSTGRRELWSLRVPYVLSMLYYRQPAGEVEGINDLEREHQDRYGPGRHVPLVALTFWTFRIMVGAGFLMLALAAYALYLPLRKWPAKWTRWLKWLVWAIPLPYLANTTGWILTEAGRQPWIVTGLLRTEQAVSPNLSGGMVLFSLIGFALVYAVLMIADVYLLVKYAKADLSAAASDSVEPAY